ncbi:MAG TPA: cytochrome c oxidase assembly factor Coa1 family protein [Pirellulales bacterium]|nr:cytochrome c oxidase assembly factor Coa1 family protein [Pirellulales bacterium]
MQTTAQASSHANREPPPNVKRGGWFGRNWLRLCFLLVLLAVLGGVGGYLYKFGPILFSTPYHQTIAELRHSPQVKQLLGEPIHDGWFPVGSVNNDEGEARLYLKLHGPKMADGHESTADVSVQARSVEGEWGFTQFDITPSGGQRLSLMDEISGPPPDLLPFNGNNAQTPPSTTEATPPPDVKIDIPDMPSDSGKK